MRIQDAYASIRNSYASKKQEPWWELLEEYPSFSMDLSGTLIDVGGGNGRNLQRCKRTLVVTLDITRELLEDYVASPDHQLIEGNLPKLPFRRCVAEEVSSIAVIHHLRTEEGRKSAVEELLRITAGTLIFTVWRKWRPSNAKKIINLIRKGIDPSSFIDHERPWKDSRGNILAKRFYHYFSRKELLEILGEIPYDLRTMGGKSGKDNYFVEVLWKCGNHSLLN